MLNSGQMIGNFKVVKKLGEGGMGQVYLVEDQKLNRLVALKILTSEFFGNTERKKRFQREAQTAAQISHPNVAAVYSMGESLSAPRLSDYVGKYTSRVRSGSKTDL